jgi:hypothetical protein
MPAWRGPDQKGHIISGGSTDGANAHLGSIHAVVYAHYELARHKSEGADCKRCVPRSNRHGA